MELKKVLAGVRKNKTRKGTDFVRLRQSAGFSMVEVCVGLLIASALAGVAVINIGAVMPGMHANKAMYQAVALFRQGRQAAIAQRRNIQLNFPDDDKIQLVRQERTGGTTELKNEALGNNFKFKQFPGITQDTPDQFGNASEKDFGGAITLTFQPDGSLVDQGFNPVNGTVFIGVDGHPEVARAVTIMGATGRVACYRWNGTEWIQ